MTTETAQITKFDADDFAANRDKYRRFKTARIASHIFTHNGEDDLEQGEYVGIKYQFTAHNALHRRSEPVYRINGGDRLLYANVLGDFCL